MKTKQKNALKFETDNIHLSDEQIDKHKNFNKLMHEYQAATKPLFKTPLYKNKKVFLVVLIVLLLIFIVIEAIQKEENNSPSQNIEQNK
jgi:hypothetical protein